MKKILLVAFITLCGVSFSFGKANRQCIDDCLKTYKGYTEAVCDMTCSKEPAGKGIESEPVLERQSEEKTAN